MNHFLIFIICLQFGAVATAAQKKDYWYKVESESKQESKQKKPTYPYDSLEKDKQAQRFSRVGFWSLKPKVSLSGGFHADKSVFSDDKLNRLFFQTSLFFANKPTQRWVLDTLLLQNNSMFVGLGWQLTPSRTASRNYYGFGVAHRLVAEKEFSNLVEFENYYVTGTLGREMLISRNHAWSIEAKAFLSSDNYAIQVSAGYIISF